jgi:hypothetical protein
MKYGNLNFLEPSGPLQACNGTALPLVVVVVVVVVVVKAVAIIVCSSGGSGDYGDICDVVIHLVFQSLTLISRSN